MLRGTASNCAAPALVNRRRLCGDASERASDQHSHSGLARARGLPREEQTSMRSMRASALPSGWRERGCWRDRRGRAGAQACLVHATSSSDRRSHQRGIVPAAAPSEHSPGISCRRGTPRCRGRAGRTPVLFGRADAHGRALQKIPGGREQTRQHAESVKQILICLAACLFALPSAKGT